MNKYIFFSTLMGLPAMATGASGIPEAVCSTETVQRPNIILILADDLGYSDLGSYGSEIRTPNLDRLADEGVRFRNMYNAARCCPTRASLLTGLYPAQTGVGYMWRDMGAKGYEGYLNEQSVTIAEVLGQAGYRTMISGKWHVGRLPEHQPAQRGFDSVYSLIGGAASYWGGGGFWVRGEERFVPEVGSFYATDAFTDEAIDFIEDTAGEDPFFLYLSYTAPHWPLHAKEEDIDRYRDRYLEGWEVLREERFARMREMGVINEEWALAPRDADTTPWRPVDTTPWEHEEDKEEMALRMAVYAAMVDSMDQGIGRVLEKVRELGQEDNTMVIFLSDNGASAESISREGADGETGKPGSYVAYGIDWAAVGNTPFRRYKRWSHEGGIATPMIVSWPDRIQHGGQWTNAISHIVDIMPTCVEAAGVHYPSEFQGHQIQPMEGHSLLPLLDNPDTELDERTLCFEHEGHSAVRRGDWKIVFHDDDPQAKLYNLKMDRGETKDLAEKYPEIVTELMDAYHEWAQRTGLVRFSDLPAVIEDR